MDKEKEEQTERYYYAGCTILVGYRQGHIFENLEGKQIIFQARSFNRPIGMAFDITNKENGMFSHKANPKAERPPSNKIEEWRVRHLFNQQEMNNILAERRLKREDKDFGEMTINELRAYANKSITAKRVVRSYLEEKLLW